jgi:hypothetical protein
LLLWAPQPLACTRWLCCRLVALSAHIPFENLTYGDIYMAADLGRGSGITPTTKVDVVSDGFQVPILSTSNDPRWVVLNQDEVVELVGMLNEVIESEGDGRGVLEGLKVYRERLVSGG